jgi:hypothetical protein
MKKLYFRLSYHQLFSAGYLLASSGIFLNYKLTSLDTQPTAKRFIIIEIEERDKRYKRNVLNIMKRANAIRIRVNSQEEALAFVDQLYKSKGALA